MLKDSCRRAAQRLRRLLSHQLVEGEEGQDLIEYALLTGIVAIVGILVFPSIQSKMADAYQGWNDNAQAISEPPPPL
jgi:hypothetical protein